MKIKRYSPLIDKLFFLIAVPSALFMAAMLALVVVIPAGAAWVIVLLCTVLVAYFLISPLFGYVELRERSVFIKCGFFLKKEIAYECIRGVCRERKWYSDSMLSLKNAMDHINIKYNRFDVFSVSVIENEELARQIEERVAQCREPNKG